MVKGKPNLLVIVADDLGYSDIGCYGSEIQTPHLDRLASDGIRLLNFHTAAACSPTRAMLLSGTDHHLTGVGCMIEYRYEGEPNQRWAGKPGHEGFLNRDVLCLAEVLQDNGYYTALSGKWHLGLQQHNGPDARGFQESFALIPGCCNHYGWEPTVKAIPEEWPIGSFPIHAKNGRNCVVEPNTTEDEDGFYTTASYAKHMIETLENRSEEDRSKPFFGYLAFSAPHWPLQAPKRKTQKYHGQYDSGPYELRRKRLERLVAMGLISPDVVPHDVVAPEVAEWDDFDEYEAKCSVRAMEAYAGMVDQMDESIGSVIDYLRRTGQYDDTMIVFMSDNGAEGAALEAEPVWGDEIRGLIHKYFDNSLDNIGRYNSFTWLGPLWAQASTAPSRLYKCFPSEGGILVPAIIKPPNVLRKAISGTTSRAFTTCMDIAPTIMDLAAINLPTTSNGKLLHRNREVYPISGKSWKGLLADPSGASEWSVYREDKPIGWELHTQAALRKGDYKIVYLKSSHGGKAYAKDIRDGWELFNVRKDSGETQDIGEQMPEKLAELLEHWDQYVQDCGLVWGPNTSEPGLTPDEAPHLHQDGMELQRTWLQVPSGGTPPP